MTGGTIKRTLLCSNILFALRKCLDELSFQVLPEAGVATGVSAVRYPDVMIRPSGGDLQERIVPDPLVVFDVVSSSSGRVDRHLKFREYRAAASIHRYVIVDGVDLTVYSRTDGNQDWTADVLTKGDTLSIPEAGIEVSINEFFVGIAADPA